MIAFYLAAAVFVAVAVALLLRPLLRTRPGSEPPGSESIAASANRSIYRDQLAELERDLSLGTLDQAQYQAARAELQRRVLEEVGSEGVAGPRIASNARRTA